MADPATASRLRRWSHPSVRVRITLAATLVTAVAVGAVGWLLVRTVEDAQIRRLRDDVEANLDQVVTRLQAGDDPTEAVEAVEASSGFVVITDERGQVVAASASAPAAATRKPAPNPSPPMAMPERR